MKTSFRDAVILGMGIALGTFLMGLALNFTFRQVK